MPLRVVQDNESQLRFGNLLLMLLYEFLAIKLYSLLAIFRSGFFVLNFDCIVVCIEICDVAGDGKNIKYDENNVH